MSKCDCPKYNHCNEILHEGTIHSSVATGCCRVGKPTCEPIGKEHWMKKNDISTPLSESKKTSQDLKIKEYEHHCATCLGPCQGHTTEHYKIEDFHAYETPKPKENDDIFQPSHYARFRIEPITFIMVNKLSFHVGNIIKYSCRAGHKLYPNCDAVQSEIKDLEKVRRYAEMRINELNGKGVL